MDFSRISWSFSPNSFFISCSPTKTNFQSYLLVVDKINKKTINCIFTRREVQRYGRGVYIQDFKPQTTNSSGGDCNLQPRRVCHCRLPDHKRPGGASRREARQRAATYSVSRPRRRGHRHGRRRVPQRRRRRPRRPEAQQPPVPGLPPATGGPAAAAAGRARGADCRGGARAHEEDGHEQPR